MSQVFYHYDRPHHPSHVSSDFGRFDDINDAMRVMTAFWKSDGPQSTQNYPLLEYNNYVLLATYVYLSNIMILKVYFTRLRELLCLATAMGFSSLPAFKSNCPISKLKAKRKPWIHFCLKTRNFLVQR